MKLTKRLRIALDKHFGGNMTELARTVGTSQQNIHNLMSGKVVKPHYWPAVADALHIPYNAFDTRPDNDDYIIKAAKEWQEARKAVCALTTKDPEYMARLNDLSNAEDRLSRLVTS